MAVPLPGDDEKTPPQVFSFEKFGTLNTQAKRPAIKENEFSWVENFFPIGDGNMRTLYAEGPALYTASGLTIVYQFPYNLGIVPYIAVFLSDSSAIQVNIDTGATTVIGPAGTFAAIGLPACAQWESKYLLIANTSGYWIWDGLALYGAGTLAPDVTVTDGGSGYTSPPTVTAYGGSGMGALFSASVANGVVTGVTVNNAGTGYLLTDHVQLAFSGGGGDTTATATAAVDNTTGGVTSVTITAGGSAYTSAAVVAFSGGGGSGATGTVLGTGGVITGVSIINPGTGYTSAPTVAFTDTGGGTGATGVAEISPGQVTSITVTNQGTGFVGTPLVSIIGDGVGATGVASGSPFTIAVTNNGAGYTWAEVVITGNNAAQATIGLMPFGLSGTTLETYQDRVWLANGTTVNFTAPDTPTDFGTPDGGGTYQATDSFLRDRVVCMKQANGFLYQFADSSINVISNVQTTASGQVATTIFNNSNVDPQVGTPWRDTVVAFGRALVFANSSGIYALYGGAAEKVSSPLDGLFEAATFNTGGMGLTPTAAVATIFGIRVYSFLFTTTDSYTKTQRNILAMWDGQKWFIGTQKAMLQFVATQEIDSVLTTWAIAGANSTLIPLFQTPDNSFTKVYQTKLRPDPSYIEFKQANRLYLVADNHSGAPYTLNMTVDTERGIGTNVAAFNIPSSTTSWTVTGIIRSDYGRLLGLTAVTTAADLVIVSNSLLWREYAPFA